MSACSPTLSRTPVTTQPRWQLPGQPSTALQPRVLALLRQHTYEEVSALTNWSRGRIYALALRTGARKTENRIRERHAERKRRQQEFMQSIIDSTTTADVLDFLDGVPDESVALHLTSIPYNLGKNYGDCPQADAMRATYYHGWIMQVISELARTVREGGVVFVNLGNTMDWQERMMPLDVLLYEDFRRAGLIFQNRIVWTVPHGLTPKSRLAGRYETCLVFSKGDNPTFNPNAARAPQKNPAKRAFKGPNKGQLSGNPYGAWPTDVWNDIPTVRHNHPDRRMGAHPAQFPVALAKRAILLYTLPGDVVSDVFCGSGSTAVGCIETGRHFIGADLFYGDLRAKRIAAAALDHFTPLPGVSDESVAVWQAEARRVEHVATPVSFIEDAQMCSEIVHCEDNPLV